MGKRARSTLLLTAALLVVHCGGPTRPSTITLASLRYLRHYPVAAAEGTVVLHIDLPIAGDRYGRSNIVEVSMQRQPDGSFTYPYLNNFDIPVGSVFSLNIFDPAVACCGPANQIGRDVVANGVLLTPRVFASGGEIDYATIDANGVVRSVSGG